MITVKIKQILETQDKTSKAGRPYTTTTFSGEDGKLYKDIYGKFTEGQEVTGEWKDTEYGLKFEIPKAPTQGFGGSRFSPEKERSISRMHAQEMAIRFLGFTDVSKKEEKELLKLVLKLADVFESDAAPKPVEVKTEGKDIDTTEDTDEVPF